MHISQGPADYPPPKMKAPPGYMSIFSAEIVPHLTCTYTHAHSHLQAHSVASITRLKPLPKRLKTVLACHTPFPALLVCMSQTSFHRRQVQRIEAEIGIGVD